MLRQNRPKWRIFLYQDGIHPEELREILFVMKPQINTLIYFFLSCGDAKTGEMIAYTSAQIHINMQTV